MTRNNNEQKIDTQIIHLDNGIRILLHAQKSPITHTCLIVNTGSRDEKIGRYGVAHFIEHLLFKQTETRSTNQILNRLESVGGDLNAFTTKEYMCIHASVLNPYLGRSLELFEDILFHSTFPVTEMDKEKSVILDEMASYLDSPEESIMDDFEDLIFKNSGLGHNILGLESDLLAIERKDILDFIQQNYNTDEIVIAVSGEYSLKTIQKYAYKYFGAIPKNPGKKSRITTISNDTIQTQIAKPINQTHLVLGSEAYGMHDPNKVGLLLLNNMLGGMGMSSILNLSIREKYGIAYTIESNYSLYTDTGLFSIYLGTEAEKAEKAEKLVQKELAKLRAGQISEGQIHKAKYKFKGQIALAEENRMSMIISEARNIIDYGRIVSLDEVFQQIDKVTTAQLLEISNYIFSKERLSSLAFVPVDTD